MYIILVIAADCSTCLLTYLRHCFRYKGWLAGYQIGFDVAKSQMVGNNFALGLDGGDFNLHASV